MKTTVLVSLIWISISSTFAQGIQFQNQSKSFDELITLAKTENKLIFIDCYTTWCGPCKQLSKNIFTQKSVGDFYNEHFICAKFDMEKGEGIQLRTQFGVSAFPTLVFVDHNQVLHHKQAGAGGVSSILELGRTALDTTKNYRAIKTKIEQGDLSFETVDAYLRIERLSGTEKDKLINSYFASLKDEKRFGNDPIRIIANHVRSSREQAFGYLFHNEAGFIQYADSALFVKTMLQVFTYDAFMIGREKEPEKILVEFRKIGHPLVEVAILRADFLRVLPVAQRNSANPDIWQGFMSTAPKFLATSFAVAEEYNEAAMCVLEGYKYANDTLAFKQGLAWASASIKKEESHYNLDTYAHYLFELGKQDEAIKTQEKAISMAISAQENSLLPVYTDRLSKLKSNTKK